MQRLPRNGELTLTRRTKSLVVIVTLALVTLTGLSIAEAQRPAKAPRIGFLSSNVAPSAPILEAFRQGLRELGWIEGQNITVEWGSTAGRDDLPPGLAAELARRANLDGTGVEDLIITYSSGPMGGGGQRYGIALAEVNFFNGLTRP
jgi:hypothetical protein